MQNLYLTNSRIITEKILIENSAPYIWITTNLTDGPIKMLIDTGASVSIITSRHINRNIEINNNKYQLMGFDSSNGSKGTTTMGMVRATAIINETNLDIPLHVVHNSCMGKMDGLLGFDFLMRYGVNIDMNKKKIHISIAKQIVKKTKKCENTKMIEDKHQLHRSG